MTRKSLNRRHHHTLTFGGKLAAKTDAYPRNLQEGPPEAEPHKYASRSVGKTRPPCTSTFQSLGSTTVILYSVLRVVTARRVTGARLPTWSPLSSEVASVKPESVQCRGTRISPLCSVSSDVVVTQSDFCMLFVLNNLEVRARIHPPRDRLGTDDESHWSRRRRPSVRCAPKMRTQITSLRSRGYPSSQ